MSNERYNQIIDEVYVNYCKSFDAQSEIESHSFDTDPMTNIMFVEKIKNLDWFSEKWGLQIEERELSHKERVTIACKQENGIIPIVPMYGDWDPTKEKMNQFLNEQNIPTKLITLTYNNETIESYE